MRLDELYNVIGGDYNKALSVLRIDKLIDKHIRKFKDNELVPSLIEAKDKMDEKSLFEVSHALKGVCGNLGLVNIATLASDIAEEFRPGNQRQLSDEEVSDKVEEIRLLFEKAKEGINRYIG